MGSRRPRHRKRSFGEPRRVPSPAEEAHQGHFVTCPRCKRVVELSEVHRGLADLEGQVVNPNALMCPHCHERLQVFGRRRGR
jgi:uncharacterized protein YbaR (Trm112 family)